MKTNTEKQAEYIAYKRNLIEKKIAEISKIVVSNTMRNKDPEKFGIELSIGSALAGVSIHVYFKNENVIHAECIGIYWPFEHMMFFHQERFDRDVNEKLVELEDIRKIAKNYFDLNNK